MRRLFLCLSAALLSSGAWAEPLVKSGESLAFLGDSITQQGAASPGGYVNLVISGLKANGIEVKPIPAGVSGNTSTNMLGRLPGVLEKKPVWLTLSCGVNDVGQQMTLEQYQKNVTAIVDKAQAAGVKVILFTASMIGENLDTPKAQTQAAFNDFLRAFAKERNLPLVEIHGAMVQAVKSTPHSGDLLTVDGIHKNPAGNAVMAAAVLQTLGLDGEQVARARAAWLDTPESGTLTIKVPLTLRQFEALQKSAQAQKVPALKLAETECQKAVEAQAQP